MRLPELFAEGAYEVTARVCPKAPPGAQQHVDDITGYVMWGVIALFAIGVLVCIGAVVAGRIFNMPHSSKTGAIGGAVVFVAAIAYLVFPAMVSAVLGSGCI